MNEAVRKVVEMLHDADLSYFEIAYLQEYLAARRMHTERPLEDVLESQVGPRYCRDC